MAVITHSFPLAHFDPLPLYLQLCSDGPGFLETLNPLPDTKSYSILPLRCQEHYLYSGDQLTRRSGSRAEDLGRQPFSVLADILEQRKVPCRDDSPFIGGFFGYLGYDLAAQIEHLPHAAERDLPIPELELYWVDICAVYDHDSSIMTLHSLDPDVDLKQWEQRIRSGPSELKNQPLRVTQPLQPRLSPANFMAMVNRAKDYIAAGDVYQVNLSCRFDGGIEGPSTEIYRRLRDINPSPFACYLKGMDVEIISSSPERLVSLRNNVAQTRPIAGTRPRGLSAEQDRKLAKELFAHPKERAEHIMLIDLERNDLGKVCTAGSVVVDELMVLERYSHVNHIVSNVRGVLAADHGPFDLLKAMFPGGTITGVPKKRCMEIIDELEPVGRGVYTGSAGYISACGTMDFNILIRSFQRLGDHISYQAGAGIVADSDPQREWSECLHKGEALQTVMQAAKLK